MENEKNPRIQGRLTFPVALKEINKKMLIIPKKKKKGKNIKAAKPTTKS